MAAQKDNHINNKLERTNLESKNFLECENLLQIGEIPIK